MSVSVCVRCRSRLLATKQNAMQSHYMRLTQENQINGDGNATKDETKRVNSYICDSVFVVFSVFFLFLKIHRNRHGQPDGSGHCVFATNSYCVSFPFRRSHSATPPLFVRCCALRFTYHTRSIVRFITFLLLLLLLPLTNSFLCFDVMFACVFVPFVHRRICNRRNEATDSERINQHKTARPLNEIKTKISLCCCFRLEILWLWRIYIPFEQFAD